MERHYFTDPRLDAIAAKADSLDEAALIEFLNERKDLPVGQLATELIRDFFGPIDVAYLLERASHSPTVCQHGRPIAGYCPGCGA